MQQKYISESEILSYLGVMIDDETFPDDVRRTCVAVKGFLSDAEDYLFYDPDPERCPFCGAGAICEQTTIPNYKNGTMDNYFRIKCTTCKAQTNLYKARKDALYNWNRRAQ